MLSALGVEATRAWPDQALGALSRGAALASYLLFESDYTRELIALGRADTLARRNEVKIFFGWPTDDAPPVTPDQPPA
jgi:NTE family protein